MGNIAAKEKLLIVERYLKGESLSSLSGSTGLRKSQIRHLVAIYRSEGKKGLLGPRAKREWTDYDRYYILREMRELGLTEKEVLERHPVPEEKFREWIMEDEGELRLPKGTVKERTVYVKTTSYKFNIKMAEKGDILPEDLEGMSLAEIADKLNKGRKENRYLRAENAVLKKLNALVAEKERSRQGK